MTQQASLNPGRLGAMAARMAPPLRLPEPVWTTPLRDRILIALQSWPLTTTGLASELDAKELIVAQTLTNMAHEGLVKADPMPPEGRRAQRWRAA